MARIEMPGGDTPTDTRYKANVLGPTRWFQDRHSLTGARCIHKMKRPKVRH